MSIGTLTDLEGMLHVGRIVSLVLKKLKSQVTAGVTTGELDQICAEALRELGARSAPQQEYGFPGWACISVNDEVVHGVPGDRVIRAGDLVTLDVTAEADGYVADAARTVVVPGGSGHGERLVACAEQAFRAGLEFARPGNQPRDIGRAVDREVRRCGFSVCRDLFGHGVGRRIHEEPDIPSYDEPRCNDVLQQGLAFTIEPLVSAGSGRVRDADDGWTVMTREGVLSAHYEETIILTDREPLIITAA